MEMARRVQSSQNKKLVIFFQYLKKSVATAFVFYCDAKHSDILRGSSHVLCYLLSLFLIYHRIPVEFLYDEVSDYFIYNKTSCLSKYIQGPSNWFYFL